MAILAGLIAGGVAGQFLFALPNAAFVPGLTHFLEFLGQTVFMGLLKMILIPLVVASVISGVSSIGDLSRLRFIGGMTLLYYFSTMLVAVSLGIFLVTSIRPGERTDRDYVARQSQKFTEQQPLQTTIDRARQAGWLGAVTNIVEQLIPSNPLKMATEGQILPVIVFSLMFGVAITASGPAGVPLQQWFEAFLAVVMRLVHWILWLTPVGVFALTAWTVAGIGWQDLLQPLFFFMLTVIVGLLIHGVVVLPLVLWCFGRTSPRHFAWNMRDALLTAFGTDSSSATLPVTIECAEGSGGCSRRASRFVLPLGATVNMDGTALYEAVAVVFLFQNQNIALSMEQLVIVALTATLAAVGAAGIPSAGLFTMVIVVQAVNDSLGPTQQLEFAAIGVIWGIDRMLDMCRTTVNVWGDAVGAKIITRIAPDPSEA